MSDVQASTSGSTSGLSAAADHGRRANRQQRPPARCRPSWRELIRGIAGSIVVTALAIGVVELASRLISQQFPAPGPLLLLAVVYSAFSGGTIAGLVSALLTIVYAATFLDQPGRPFHYTPANLSRLSTLSVAAPTMALLVGLLRRRVEHTAAQLSRKKIESHYRRRLLEYCDQQGIVF